MTTVETGKTSTSKKSAAARSAASAKGAPTTPPVASMSIPDAISAGPRHERPTLMTYAVRDHTVTASLLDAGTGEQIGESRDIVLENLSPEQIGLTIPELWDLMDTEKLDPESVVLLGDVDTDVVQPIVELALGVPAVTVDAVVTEIVGLNMGAAAQPEQAAVADVVAEPVSDVVAEPVSDPVAEAVVEPVTAPVPVVGRSEESVGPEPVTEQAADHDDPPTAPIAVVEPAPEVEAFSLASDRERVSPAAVAAAATSEPTLAPAGDTGRNRRGLLVAAAVTAVALAGGIGAAVALSGNEESTSAAPSPSPVAQNVDAAASQPAASPTAEAVAPAPAPAAQPPAEVPPPAETPDAPTPADVAPRANASAWPQSQSNPPAPTAAPWTAPSAAEPPATRPQFTVPVPVPDPNNPDATPQELQDKAWADHWDNTFRYLEQGGG